MDNKTSRRPALEGLIDETDLPRAKGCVRFSFGANDELTVSNCPYCNETHEHNVERTAPSQLKLYAGCGLGAYVVELPANED